MDLERLKRLPRRIIQDTEIIAITKNWREILKAKISRKPITKIEFRNGVVLNSPDEVNLMFIFHEIWLDKIYSPKGYEIKPNETVVDIGGNIGVFALFAATRENGVYVHSFEPFPANAKFFKQNLDDSHIKNIVFHNLAVADKSIERVLQIEDSWLNHSLIDQDSKTDGIVVKCISLDEALAKVAVCDLLKLDCEGSEYEILYSCSSDSIKKIKKIVGEFHNVDNETRNGEGLRKFLKNNGYQIDVFYSLDNKSGIICARSN